MALSSKREKRLWQAAGLCILLIYSSLYIARPIAEYLRDRNLLRLSVALIFLAVAGAIGWRLAMSRPNLRVVLSATLVGVAYCALLTSIPMLPEERLHFLQYGAVAALIYLALEERRLRLDEAGTGRVDLPTRLPSIAVAAVATGVLGWIDEGIQAILPNRYYDIRDVAFNAAAGIICLASLRLVEWARASE